MLGRHSCTWFRQ